jgi:CBS domain-containing protein
MRRHGIGDVLVVHEGRLRGLVTDRDIVVRAVAEDADPHALTVGDVASFTSVRLRPSDSLEHALQVMATHQIRHVAVVDDDDRVVGSITQTGIARTAQEPRRSLKPEPLLPIS